jgi:hypothetical protein
VLTAAGLGLEALPFGVTNLAGGVLIGVGTASSAVGAAFTAKGKLEGDKNISWGDVALSSLGVIPGARFGAVRATAREGAGVTRTALASARFAAGTISAGTAAYEVGKAGVNLAHGELPSTEDLLLATSLVAGHAAARARSADTAAGPGAPEPTPGALDPLTAETGLNAEAVPPPAVSLGKPPPSGSSAIEAENLLRQTPLDALPADTQNRVRQVLSSNTPLSASLRQQLNTEVTGRDWATLPRAEQADRVDRLLTDPSRLPPNVAEDVGAPADRDVRLSNGGRGTLDTPLGPVPVQIAHANLQGGLDVPIVQDTRPRPAGEHQHSAQEVATALSHLPPETLRLVHRVVIHSEPNPHDKFWEQEYGRPDFRSYMTAGADGTVDIYPTTHATPEPFLETSLIHESGHLWSNRLLGPDHTGSRWTQWKKAAGADRLAPSNYATSSPAEDIAETSALYLSTRGTPAFDEYRKLFPNRFAYLDVLYPSGASR